MKSKARTTIPTELGQSNVDLLEQHYKGKERCPECWGEMKDGKCMDCGWTPEFGKVYQQLKDLEEEMGS